MLLPPHGAFNLQSSSADELGTQPLFSILSTIKRSAMASQGARPGVWLV
jgi:hypothetical protein